MTSRSLVDRLLTPAGFGLALLMFLLPFVTVSCAAEAQADARAGVITADVSFTGVDMLTGDAPDISLTAPSDTGEQQTVHLPDEDLSEFEREFGPYHPVQPLAAIAAVLIFVSMVLTLMVPLRHGIPIGAAGALAAIILLTVQVAAVSPRLARQAYDEKGHAPALEGLTVTMQTVPAFGFYSVVGLLVVVLIRQFFLARRPRAETTDGADSPAETAPPP